MQKTRTATTSLSDLTILSFEKNSSVSTGPGDSPIKNCFGSIEDLPIGFNCTEGIFASQDSYGFTATYLNFEQEKKVKFFPEQGGCLLRKLLQYDLSLTYILSFDLLKYLGSKLLWV